MTASRKRPGLGWVAAAGAAALAVAWSLICPWLVALPSSQAAALLPVELAGAIVVGLIAWRAARGAAALGPRGAVRFGAVFALAGAVASLAAGLALLRPLGAAAGVALALVAGGATICIALVVMLLGAWRIGRKRGDGELE